MHDREPSTITAFDEANDDPNRPQATAEATIPVATFEDAYAATPPWDIPGPQPAFARLAWSGAFSGRVLDIGCGTGENALFLAARGLDVVGLDASQTAIAKARAKAAERKTEAVFVVGDALELATLGRQFDTVIECGLLHVLSDRDRARLVASVAAVLRAGGRYFVLCLSEHATIPGPRRLTADEIRAAFTEGWRVESIVPTHIEINVTETGSWNSERAAAWLACIERL